MKRNGQRTPLSVVGLEVEYAVVDADMNPRPLVEALFQRMYGRHTSQLGHGPVGFSNELAAHVLEAKTQRPHRSLVTVEGYLQRGVVFASQHLRDAFGARLFPTGMHPWMRPQETSLWPRAGRKIYEAYAQLFTIREHGWLNVQSCHVNLPFGIAESDAILQHNVLGALIPYLPAVAASSPVVERRIRPYLDNRLYYYLRNQRRIPEITSGVVPERVESFADYRRRILQPIYGVLRTSAAGRRLCHEWVNSRGVILRFDRRALELRVLDVQECVRMDVALAAFVRSSVRALSRAVKVGETAIPSREVLIADFNRVIRDGRDAFVCAPHLAPASSAAPRRAAVVLEQLLELARRAATPEERRYLVLVERRVTEGSLAERIRARLRGRPGSSAVSATRLRDVYEELITCLEENRPWQ